MSDLRRIEHRPLTATLSRVLAYCDKFLTQNDQLPTYQAISDHFGWASTNAAYEAMVSLERRGLVERNTLGKWRFTEDGRSRIPECVNVALHISDER